jgi:ssDNA-binding Zn-finger/Zn-ribbon topoisomerase 1
VNYADYSPDWKDIIRPSILKRDNYVCKKCGIGHKKRVYRNTSGVYVECDEFIEEWAKANGFKVFTLFLVVAHLDNDKKNNKPANLLTLCPKCHALQDAQHKKQLRIALMVRPSKESCAEVITPNLKEDKSLQEITALVKTLTGHRIAKHEALAIFKLIIKNK